DADFSNFIGKLVRSFEQGTTLASHFLKRDSWDVFMVHFQQTDWIQHKLWGYIDRACRNENDRSARLQLVRNCYREFDRYLGQLLEQLQLHQVVTFILSDHGFGGNFGTICADYVLRKLGYYRLLDDGGSSIKQSLRESRFAPFRGVYTGLRKLRNAARARQSLNKYKTWADLANATVSNEKSRVDWSHTKAAFVTGSEVGFIYLNRKGRGPCGCVEPGSEYERMIATLIQEFHKLRHPHSGSPLVEQVARGEQIYGRRSHEALLPDLVLIPKEGYVVGSGLDQGFIPEDGARGNHRLHGVLLAQGAGIRSRLSEFRPNLIDLAPTILYILQLPVPSDMDGRVLEELFEESHPVDVDEVDNSQNLLAQDYAQEEAELIEQRLRGLGYLE